MSHELRASGGTSRVLIVEDHQDDAETLAHQLALHGHEVRIARDGAQALEIARALHPDHALLDLGSLGGTDIAQRLRRLADTPLTLIALTEFGQADTPGRTLEPGFDHHFPKPIAGDELDRLLAVLGPGSRPANPSAAAFDLTPGDGLADGSSNPLLGESRMVASSLTRASRRDIEIINEHGLHLRAADRIVRTARRFQARTFVGCAGRLASANSILDLTILMAQRGDRLNLEAEGPDAEAAIDALRHLVENGFEEPAQPTNLD